MIKEIKPGTYNVDIELTVKETVSESFLDELFNISSHKVETINVGEYIPAEQEGLIPLGGQDIEGNNYAICRHCSAIVSDGNFRFNYCPDCGKKVNWNFSEQADKELVWTDGDLQVMIYKESETAFFYGEVRKYGDGYIYCTAAPDINNYTHEEIKDILHAGYPNGITEVKETYKQSVNQIICECIFEHMDMAEMSYVSELYKTKDEAAKELKGYAEGYIQFLKLEYKANK